MANNPWRLEATLKDNSMPATGQDLSIGSAVTPVPSAAKVLLDDEFIAGIADLDPYLAALIDPALVVIDIEDTDGATISFDSGVSFSAFSARKMILQFAGVGVPATLQVTLANPSRIRMWAYGD